MNLNVRQLEAFVCLARLGGFSRAAGRLHMSQAGLSILIKRLEERLDVKLVERGARQLVLTPTGEQLLPIAERILGDADTMLSLAREAGQSAGGSIRLAIAPALAVSILPSVLRRFSERHKQVTVDVIECANDELLEQLRESRVDFGLAYGAPADRELACQLVAREEMIAVCPPDHPLLALETLRWSDLVGHPLIAALPGNQSRALIEAVFAGLGQPFAPKFSSSNLLTAVELASRRLGVAIVSTCVMPAVLASGLSARTLCQPVQHRELNLLCLRSKESSLPPCCHDFIELLREAMADAGCGLAGLARGEADVSPA